MKTIDFIKALSATWNLPEPKVVEYVSLPGTMKARIDISEARIELRCAMADDLTDELCFVIAHELRHLWQYINGWSFEDYIADSTAVELYNGQKIEVDAHAFSINICDITLGRAPMFRNFSEPLRKKIFDRVFEQDKEESHLFDDLANAIDSMNNQLSPAELAKAANVSLATVYNVAKKLGRMPTVAELKKPRRPGPKKY